MLESQKKANSKYALAHPDIIKENNRKQSQKWYIKNKDAHNLRMKKYYHEMKEKKNIEIQGLSDKP